MRNVIAYFFIKQKKKKGKGRKKEKGKKRGNQAVIHRQDSAAHPRPQSGVTSGLMFVIFAYLAPKVLHFFIDQVN